MGIVFFAIVWVAACFVGPLKASEAAPSGSVGQLAPDVVLASTDGKPTILSDFNRSRAFVIVFLGTECPIANRYIPRLNAMAAEPGNSDCQWIGVYSQRGATLEQVKQHAEEYKISFPVFVDEHGELARALGATRMAEAFVIDATYTVRYQGRIDDQIGYRSEKASAGRADLRLAVEQVLERKPVETPFTPVEGCKLALADLPSGIPEKPTWADHVSAIVQTKCQSCHHEGTSAPFVLASLEDVRDWAPMIGEVVKSRRMPPWHADPRHGAFTNDRSLTSQERETMLAWLEQGMPEGDLAKAPPAKKYTAGWMIDEPDVVFELPEEVKIPADGVMPYQYFETPSPFKEDVYISSAEATPGNRAVVHHIIAFYKPPGTQLGGNAGLERNWIVGTAPGDMPLILPPDTALKIPAGSSIVWQMHYTPTGKEERDRSRIGLRFYRGEKPPSKLVRQAAPHNEEFTIPAETHHFETGVKPFEVKQDSYLLSFLPHMHLRGKSFRFEAETPSGERTTLLSVPRFDFNWQSTYMLKEPMLLPKGSKIHCTAAFNNSADNPANPDPSSSVRWGDQTFEEMLIGYVKFIPAHEDGGSASQ